MHMWEPACIVELQLAMLQFYMIIAVMGLFPDIFLLSVALKNYTRSSYTPNRKNNNIMFGALGNTWKYNFCMGMPNKNLEKLGFRIFDSHVYIEDMPLDVSHRFIQGSRTFAMFYAHVLREKLRIPVMNAHGTLMTFTRFVQNGTVWCMIALYGPAMHVATLKPYFQAR